MSNIVFMQAVDVLLALFLGPLVARRQLECLCQYPDLSFITHYSKKLFLAKMSPGTVTMICCLKPLISHSSCFGNGEKKDDSVLSSCVWFKIHFSMEICSLRILLAYETTNESRFIQQTVRNLKIFSKCSALFLEWHK